MQIKSSADLRNSYKEISELAKASGEPIYITINGSGDGVFMSMEAFEQMEEKLLMRSRVLAAENAVTVALLMLWESSALGTLPNKCSK